MRTKSEIFRCGKSLKSDVSWTPWCSVIDVLCCCCCCCCWCFSGRMWWNVKDSNYARGRRRRNKDWYFLASRDFFFAGFSGLLLRSVVVVVVARLNSSPNALLILRRDLFSSIWGYIEINSYICIVARNLCKHRSVGYLFRSILIYLSRVYIRYIFLLRNQWWNDSRIIAFKR